VKRIILAVAAFAVAFVALSQLSQYKDWARSPEAYFLTAAEKQEWSKVASDADAEKFIADYWAKRGGQRFKEGILRRIAAADQQFKMRRQKGSESARGRIFITMGNPSRVVEAREGGEPAAPEPGSATGTGALDSISGESSAVIQTWTYLKDKFDPAWDVGEVIARINVDPQRGTDELLSGGAINKAIEKVVQHSILPAGQAAPGVAAVKPGAPAAATGPAASGPAAAAPAPVAEALPAAPRAVLEPLLKKGSEKASAGYWGGVFQTVTGEPFYAFQIIRFGKKDEPAPSGMKLGGVVTKDDGQEATSFWEDAASVDTKGRDGVDKASDHSIVLPAGTYRGAFGLFAPDGGAALATGTAVFTIPERSGDFRVSPLILASTLTPLTRRPNPTDPFVFGMEKPIRVEPKGNGVFTREDGLWYFYTVTNPGLPAEAPATVAPAAVPTPDAASAAPAAAPTAIPAPKPRIMTRIGVLRDGKPAFQPATVPADMQALGAGYYASGSEIPLATFQPGYYTFTLNVRDLNAPRDSAAFKGIDRSGDFIVLTPEGAMPPTPTPAPTPTPKPRAKKS
jgi:GWxTD domain-containing protein